MKLQHYILALFICFLGIPDSSQAQSPASPLILIEGNTNSEQRAILHTQFAKAYFLLPPKMKTVLEQKKKFKIYTLKIIDLGHNVAGQSSQRGEIHININLLSNEKLLLKTLVHELAHIYDWLQAIPDGVTKALIICDGWGYTTAPPDYCALYKNVETTVSTLPSFLDATGWYLEFAGKGERIKETTLGYRSPDAYERTNSKEMFAVNMEYFLTDPEYKCRRPSIYKFLKSHFGYEPFKDNACDKELTFIDAKFKNAEKALITIDPNRVYAIHYLLASPGDEIVSSFGHSLIHVVVCAPNRKALSADCLKDTDSHLVLTFRGFVDSPQSSAISGLLGDYPSRLFILPFTQVKKEYNSTELRDLYSYPLNLSRNEINSFLDKAIETHWSHKSNYYFLSNNCAIETMNLFKSGIQNPRLRHSMTQKPTGVLEELQRAKLIDPSFSINEGSKDIYYFPSVARTLNKDLEIINKLTDNDYSIEDWMSLSPAERRSIFDSQNVSDSIKKKSLIASFLDFEIYILNRIKDENNRNLVPDDIQESSEKNPTIKALMDSILKSLAFDNQLTAPANLVQPGYGIPSPAELKLVQLKLNRIQESRDKNQSYINSLMNQLMKYYRSDDVEKIQDNIKFFDNEMWK